MRIYFFWVLISDFRYVKPSNKSILQKEMSNPFLETFQFDLFSAFIKMTIEQICNKFLKKFDKIGGNPDEKHYESALQWTHGQILKLDHVTEVSVGASQYTFLVSHRNKMALFKSTVRRLCRFDSQFLFFNIYHFYLYMHYVAVNRPYSTAAGNRRKVKRHPYSDQYQGLATTTGKGRCAVKAFFSEPQSESNSSSKYAGFTLIILVGDENAFFIRQEEIITPSKRKANLHRIRVFDSIANRNVPRISENFASTFNRREIFCYSDSIHKIIDWKGKCGHSVYLEIFLHFEQCQNPFDRNVHLNDIRKYKGMGHHGPGTHNPNKPYVRKQQDRNRPNHQFDATED